MVSQVFQLTSNKKSYYFYCLIKKLFFDHIYLRRLLYYITSINLVTLVVYLKSVLEVYELSSQARLLNIQV